MFLQDVSENGTGHSTRSALTRVCTDGYFSSLQGTIGTYTAACRTGRGIRLEDAYHILASDPKVVPLGADLTIPGLATTYRNLPLASGEGTNLTVVDTGSAVQDYHLDVFVGQGPGDQANWPTSGINSPSERFMLRHRNLGTVDITLPNGKTKHAIGRTSVYQRLSLSQLTGELLKDLLCRSE